MEDGYETINSESAAKKKLSSVADTVDLAEQRKELFNSKYNESLEKYESEGLDTEEAVKEAEKEAEKYAKEKVDQITAGKISMVSDNFKKDRYKKSFDKSLKSSWTNSDISGELNAELIGLSDSNAKDLRKAKGQSGTTMGDISYTTEDGLKKTAFGLQSNLAGLTKRGEKLGWDSSDVSYLQNLLLEYVDGVTNVPKSSKVTPFKNGKFDESNSKVSNGKVQLYKYSKKDYDTIMKKMKERVKDEKQASAMVHTIINSSYENDKGERIFGANRFGVDASNEIKGGQKATHEASFVGPQKPGRNK
jgi:hypothetical protein